MKKRAIVLTIFLLATCLMLTACDGAAGGLLQELLSELEDNVDSIPEELSQLIETIPEDFTIPESITIPDDFTLPELTEPETEIVEGEKLQFESNGDGTCTVVGIGTCTDMDIVIPAVSPDGDRVTSIGESAFYDCSGLTSIVIPDGVISIGDYAFASCSGLTSIVIPDGVTSIGKYAFEKCSGLTSVVIPDSITDIGKQVFSGCDTLTDVYFTGTELEWAVITLDTDNDSFSNATLHFNYVP